MNKRIRELAGQAGFETEHHKWIFANDNVGEGECHELLEKFAELIVRECIESGNDLAKHYINNHSEQEQAFLLAAIADYSNEIKKRFGVKE